MLRRNVCLTLIRDTSHALLLSSVIACGALDEPRYVPYDNPNGAATGTGTSADAQGGTAQSASGTPSTTGSTTQSCSDTALASFNVYVQNEVSSKCSNAACHGNGGGGAARLPMSAKDTAANRTTIKAYLSGDANKIVTKFQSGTHSGGDLSQSLTQAEIGSWLSAESKCPG